MTPRDRSFFDRYADGRVQPLRRLRIDTSTAQPVANPLEVRLGADFIYIDPDSTATGVYARFNNQVTDDRFPLARGMSIADMPIESLFLDWSSSAGTFLNLWYGLGVRLTPRTDLIDVNTVGSLPRMDAFQHYKFNTDDTRVYSRGNTVNAVAAQSAYGQIWNPPGSGVYVFVYASRIALTGASIIQLRYETAAQAGTGGGTVAGINNRNMSLTGVAQFITGAVAAITGSIVKSLSTPGDSPRDLIPAGEYFRLAEGEGLTAWCNSQNLGIRVDFTWSESNTGA